MKEFFFSLNNNRVLHLINQDWIGLWPMGESIMEGNLRRGQQRIIEWPRPEKQNAAQPKNTHPNWTLPFSSKSPPPPQIRVIRIWLFPRNTGAKSDIFFAQRN